MSGSRNIVVIVSILAVVSCGGGDGPAGPNVMITAPTAPSNLVATAMAMTQINLTWTDGATNEDGFKIDRCTGAACSTFTEVASLAAPNTTGYQDLSVGAATSYTYRVRAYNAAGTSAPSANATAVTTTPATPPTAPTGASATAVSSSQINLAWTDASTNETGFAIERCSGAGCSSFAALTTTAANATAYQNTGLAATTSYSYRVRAVNASGTSAWSSTVTAVTQAPTPVPPAPPSGLTAGTVSSSQINLTWTDASNNETSFKIERCSGAGCSSFAEIQSLAANTTSFQNSGLAASTSYTYRVRAANAAGNSAYSEMATAVTSAPLTAPTLNVPVVSGSSLTLTWSFTWPGGLGSSNDHYSLEQSASATSGFTEVVADFSHTSPQTVTLQNRAPGTYYFRVRAFTNQGTSPYSVVRSAVVAATEAEITVFVTEDNKLLWSTGDASLGNTVIRTGYLEIGCNFSVLPYNSEVLCGEALMRFNAGAQIAGRTIISAELRLSPVYLGADFNTTFTVAAVARTWNSSTVTANNFHNGSEVYLSGQVIKAAPTSGLPYTFDITAIVQSWANGSFADQGLVIWDNATSFPPDGVIRAAGFESADSYSAANRRPQIVIRYR